jgi:type I restriction enzyme S subunit
VPPSKGEQEAIAGALNDTDALIESLEQLLAKKRLIKQGAVQQLLTGKKRMKGFSGSWPIRSMSELTDLPIQNGVFNEPARKGRGCKLINVSDLYMATPIDTSLLELFDADNGEVQRFGVSHGDIFFTRSSLTPEGIAHCNVYKASSQETLLFDCHLIRTRPNLKKVDPFFLFRYCVSAPARKYLVTNAKTTTMTTIDQSVVANMPIPVPELKEQNAIAEILAAMDAEIVALESKLTKARGIKHGMMQELLMGRVRLQ